MKTSKIYLLCLMGYLLWGIQTAVYSQQNTREQLSEVLLSGNYAEVNELYTILQKSRLPKEHHQQVEHYNALGELALRLSKFAEAEKHWLKSIKLADKLQGYHQYEAMNAYMGYADLLRTTEHLDDYLTYVNLAPNHGNAFNDWFLKNSQSLFKNLSGEEYLERCNRMELVLIHLSQSMAEVSLSIKDYNEALKQYQEGLDKYVKEKITEPLLHLELLEGLGMTYNAAGQYENALQSYEQCIAQTRQYGKPQSSREAFLLTQVGDIYTKLGNQAATQVFQTAREILSRNGEGNTLHYATLLFQMALQQMSIQKPQEALSLLQQCTHTQHQLLSTDNPICLRTQIYIGDVYLALGELEKASDLFDLLMTKDIAIMDFVHLCRSIAELTFKEEAHSIAGQFIDTSIEILNVMPDSDPTVLRPSYNLGGYAWMMSGKPEKALGYFEKQLELERKQAHDIFAFLPEKQRAGYWREVEGTMNRLFLANREGTVVMKGGTVLDVPSQNKNQMSTLLYNASLLNKGLMLEASVNLSHIIRQSGDKKLEELHQQLTTLRRQLATTQEATISVARNKQLKQAEDLERQIIARSRAYGDYMKFTSLTWEDVKKALKPREVAIEFVCSKENGIDFYSAEVLRANSAKPQHLFLMAVPQQRDWLTDEKNYHTQRLTNKLWKKILPYLKPGETVYFSPAGQLYNVGIEYLPLDAQTRMNDRYRMVRLSSTRELALKRTTNTHKKAVLYGGLNYNTGIEDMQLFAANFDTSTALRGGFHTEQGITRNLWSYLKGTKQEVEEIEQQLLSSQYDVSTYTDEEGVEESFKALSGEEWRIIHIATHGFYLPEEKQKQYNYLSNYASSTDNALTRSGLVFSGANHAWMNQPNLPEALDDGILTAQEISLLNFAGTDLVAMSACQTGLGDITSEGIFGLQRAFKQAGVQTLLMSLWPVNDEATQVMMSEFYKQLAHGKAKRAAFLLAQEKVKSMTFHINGAAVSGTDPSLWAAFIMMD